MSATPVVRHRDPFYGFKPGQVLATKYMLLTPLAAGGMGQVWAARNLSTGAEIAIKMLLPERSGHAEVARFRLEAHATAQLAHRGIVRVFDLVDLPDTFGSVAMVMERLRGRTLGEHLAHVGPLTVDQTLAIVVPILGALHHAHGFGTIHRDLKPENVFLSLEPDGAVLPKLLDFGVSKTLRANMPGMTGDGLVVGTPSHMAPEQMRGAEVDARADVFSAGILLHLCLTGRNPFTPADDSLEALLEAVNVVPERPACVPRPLWKVIARALAPRQDDRFASAAELSVALSVAAGESSRELAAVKTPAAPPRSALVSSTRRRITRTALAASLVAISFAALGSPSERRDAHRHERVPATRAAEGEPRSLLAGVDRLVTPSVESDEVAIASRGRTETARTTSTFMSKASSFAHPRVSPRGLLVLRDPGF